MNQRDAAWLRLSGTFGILAPIVALVLISLAIFYSPQFSWTENALSDLGIQQGVTPLLFNYGLIAVGIFALVFASGLFVLFKRKALGIVGALVFVLADVALVAIGVFPENVKPAHIQASVAFFVLFSISLLIIAAAFLLMKDFKMGSFTFLAAAVSAVVWTTYFATRFVHGVAIPEAVSAASVGVWATVLGLRMLKKART